MRVERALAPRLSQRFMQPVAAAMHRNNKSLDPLNLSLKHLAADSMPLICTLPLLYGLVLDFSLHCLHLIPIQDTIVVDIKLAESCLNIRIGSVF
jgi:hypothetical protein